MLPKWISEYVGGIVGARGGAPLLGWARRLIPMDMSVTHRREHDEGAGGPSFFTRALTTLSLGLAAFLTVFLAPAPQLCLPGMLCCW